MPISTTVPAAFEADDELRELRALEAMAALEFMLEELAPAALLPVGYVRSLVGLQNDAVREVLLWEPKGAAANDNG